MSMVTLGVADVAVATAFYTRLGFPLRPESNEHVSFFELNGAWLGLFGRAALAEDAHLPCDPAVAPPFSGFSLAHNVQSEAEVDAVFAEALAAGAREVKAPERVFWGGYSGYFQDPDGYLWEVAHNPHFWVGPAAEGG